MLLLHKTSNGRVEEDPAEGIVHVFRTGVRNFDGILDTYTCRSRYHYRTGLYQEETCTGYDAGYVDIYRDREYCIKNAIHSIS